MTDAEMLDKRIGEIKERLSRVRDMSFDADDRAHCADVLAMLDVPMLLASLRDARQDGARLREALTKLPRFDAETGGCGDPECCGTYATMSRDDLTGDWVKYEDVQRVASSGTPGEQQP